MENRENNVTTVLNTEHLLKTRYEFDFDKIKTTEDVIRVIKGLRINFNEDFPAFEEIKDLVKEIKNEIHT